MTLLQDINSPADLRRLKIDQLQEVAEEIRQYILETMPRIGGHTGASLPRLATAARELAHRRPEAVRDSPDAWS